MTAPPEAPASGQQGKSSVHAGKERIVRILTAHDLHGFVDGVRSDDGSRVGGIDAIKRITQDYKDGRRGVDGGDVFLYLVGDMLCDRRYRAIHSGTGLAAWEAILDELDPNGVTFGNHEIRFAGVPHYVHPSIHCHNLGIEPKSEHCCGYGCARHENAVWKAGTGTQGCDPGKPDDFPFCGVVDNKQSLNQSLGVCVDNPATAAGHCPDDWSRMKGLSPIWLLLAHYDDKPPWAFRPPDPRYKIVLKAHDHHPSPRIANWTPYNGSKPIVVEASPNGRSVGVLELKIRNSDSSIAEYRFIHVRDAPEDPSGSYNRPWSRRNGLGAKWFDAILECNDKVRIPRFGGEVDEHFPYRRSRACCLGLRGLANVFKADCRTNHVFLISPTAVRDESLVPDEDRPANVVDAWDLVSVYGAEDTYTFSVGRTQLERALKHLLSSAEISPRTYDDQAKLVALYRDACYQLTCADDRILAARLRGTNCEPDSTPSDLSSLMPDAGSSLYVTLPHFEQKLVKTTLGSAARLKPRDRRNLLRPQISSGGTVLKKAQVGTIDKTSVADSVARLFKELPRPVLEEDLYPIITCWEDDA